MGSRAVALHTQSLRPRGRHLPQPHTERCDGLPCLADFDHRRAQRRYVSSGSGASVALGSAWFVRRARHSQTRSPRREYASPVGSPGTRAPPTRMPKSATPSCSPASDLPYATATAPRPATTDLRPVPLLRQRPILRPCRHQLPPHAGKRHRLKPKRHRHAGRRDSPTRRSANRSAHHSRRRPSARIAAMRRVRKSWMADLTLPGMLRPNLPLPARKGATLVFRQ